MRLKINRGRGSNIYVFAWRFMWYRKSEIYLGVNVWRRWVSISIVWRADASDEV